MRPVVTITERPDGQRAISAHLDPPPALAPFIELMWCTEGPLDAPRERVLPAATADLIFNLGPPMRLIEGAGDATIRGATISGLILQPLLLEHPPYHRALGLRLRPGGLRALLGAPPGVALDQTLALDDLIGSHALAITERLANIEDPAAALCAAARWAIERLAISAPADALALWTAQQIERSHGLTPIADLQHKSGWGATRFISRFRDEYGVTPKLYARLVRFRRALDLLGPDTPLIQLALDAGFSDQPHLNAEFRRLAHHTPSQILDARYPSGLTLAASP